MAVDIKGVEGRFCPVNAYVFVGRSGNRTVLSARGGLKPDLIYCFPVFSER